MLWVERLGSQRAVGGGPQKVAAPAEQLDPLFQREISERSVRRDDAEPKHVARWPRQIVQDLPYRTVLDGRHDQNNVGHPQNVVAKVAIKGKQRLGVRYRRVTKEGTARWGRFTVGEPTPAEQVGLDIAWPQRGKLILGNFQPVVRHHNRSPPATRSMSSRRPSTVNLCERGKETVTVDVLSVSAIPRSEAQYAQCLLIIHSSLVSSQTLGSAGNRNTTSKRGSIEGTKGAIHISLVPESGWPHPIPNLPLLSQSADRVGGLCLRLKLVREDLEHTQVISHDNHALGTAHAF